MDDTAKYLIHTRIAADGVVERSDVVGAVFGQTEGLLGDELDLRDLQQSSKVGRIDVEISSENGQSFGELTIATSLDKAETAVLGASLETIERVGPCRATIEVTSIEDVRAAKRRAVVDRAKELLATAFDETAISSEELLSDVRASVQVEEIAEYAGLPAGPSVASSDAIIIVEGRADVLQLLKHGIKNAIGVEGTNVPDAVAELTTDRTVTVFVDGDRGGELILRELLQVGEVDYVVFAPADRSVEDLSRADIHSLLREKIAADRIGDTQNIRETITGLVETSRGNTTLDQPSTTGSVDQPATTDPSTATESATEVEVIPTSSDGTDERSTDSNSEASAEPMAGPQSEPPTGSSPESTTEPEPASVNDQPAVDQQAVVDDGQPPTDAGQPPAADAESTPDDGQDTADTDQSAVDDESTETANSPESPATLRSHVQEIIDAETGRARLLTESFGTQAELDPADLVETLESGAVPFAVVIDGELGQAVLDVAAQRGVDHIIARSTGDFVKQPVGTRVLTAEQLLADPPDVTA